MAILDIDNRTENWHTARVLAPLVEKPSARASLASYLVGQAEQCGDSVEFELFWKGIHDYIHERQDQNDEDYATEFTALYRDCFPTCGSRLNAAPGSSPSRVTTTSSLATKARRGSTTTYSTRRSTSFSRRPSTCASARPSAVNV